MPTQKQWRRLSFIYSCLTFHACPFASHRAASIHILVYFGNSKALFLGYLLSFSFLASSQIPFQLTHLLYSMEEGQKIALSHMRDALEKLGCSSKTFDDITLVRFLKARCMDANMGAKMFAEWRRWRESFVPLGFIPEREVSHQLEGRKIYLAGPSRHGHPILIVQARKHFPHKDHLQLKKFVVHLLDKVIASGFRERELGNEKIVAILDLSDITYRNIDARALIIGFQFLQSYYPERLAKLYMLQMPWIFVSVWKMVSRFLDKSTLEKVVIVKNEEDKETFLSEIGEPNLPEEYGGRANLVALQDVQLPHWPSS